MASNERRGLAGLLGALLVLLLVNQHPLHVNAWARFALTKAIVLDHSLKIDNYYNGKIYNTSDWAYYGGHYYTNKAPGASLLGVPFYALAVRFEKSRGLDPAAYEQANLDFVNFWVTVLPTLLSTFLCFLFLKEREKESPAREDWFSTPLSVSAAFALGTMILPFSSYFWGHPTVSFLIFTFYFFCTRSRKNFWIAGACLGMGILSEYTALFCVPGLCYYLWVAEKNGSKRAWAGAQVLIGALPFLGIFFWYHAVCFGGPLTLPQKYQNPEFLVAPHGALFGVLSLPSPYVAFKLLFGSNRGLFLISPFLIFAFAGFRGWFRAPDRKAEAAFALSIVLLFFLFNASFNGWHGGYSSGPRYLIPVLPFLAASLLWVRKNRIYLFFLAISLINMIAILSTTLTAAPHMNLLRDVIYRRLFQDPEALRKFILNAAIIVVLAVFLRMIQRPSKTHT